jgi:hypothetical protein
MAVPGVQIGEDSPDAHVAEAKLAEDVVRFVDIRDGFVEGSTNYLLDDVAVGPQDEVDGMLGLDLGAYVVVEESLVSDGVDGIWDRSWGWLPDWGDPPMGLGRTWRIRRCS